ncbi:CDP-diacylglycerol--glycerol-3-phosphate 3-phosphatidyltransferase [Deltaproteobacteria bacterium TL4]
MVRYFAKWVTPNQLTVLRICMIPVIYLLIALDTPFYLNIAAVLFTFACMTDYWDGVLARFQGISSDLGKLLDPIADKLLVSTVLVLLVSLERVSPTIAAILIAREFTVSGLRSIAVTEGVVIQASPMAKIKTIVQMISIGFLIVHHPTFGIPAHTIGTIFLWISLLIAIWSGAEYFYSYYNVQPPSDD